MELERFTHVQTRQRLLEKLMAEGDLSDEEAKSYFDATGVFDNPERDFARLAKGETPQQIVADATPAKGRTDGPV